MLPIGNTENFLVKRRHMLADRCCRTALTMSLRMTAVTTTLNGLPLASSRAAKSRRHGLSTVRMARR